MRVVMSLIFAAVAMVPATAQVVGPGAGCTTCRADEMAVIDKQTIGKGRYTYTAKPTCQSGGKGDLQKAIAAIGQAFLKDYAGAITQLVDTDEFRGAVDQVHGDVGKILNGGKTDSASCQLLCNIVPLNAKVTGYSISAGENSDSLKKCEAGKDCSIGWSKFAEEPFIDKDANSQSQCVTFMNWSADRDRTGRLVTFFVPPTDWVKSRDF